MRLVLRVFVLYLFYSCKTFGTIHVKLKTPNENDGLLGSTQEYVLETIKNRSSDSVVSQKNDLDTFAVFIYSHSPEEYTYRKFRNGELDSLIFNKTINYYDMDTSKMNYPKYDAESLILMGRKKNGDCIIIADENNNNQFSDDSVFVFRNWFYRNERINNDSLPTVTFSNLISNYDNKQIVFSASVRIKPLKRDTTLKANGRSLLEMRPSLISAGYLMGKFKVNGKKYKIAVRNLSPKYIFDNRNTIIAIAAQKRPFDFQIKRDVSSLYHIGETINLGKRSVELNEISVDGSSISLNVVPGNANAEKIENIVVKDFLTKESFYLKSFFETSNYLLIDFWGSWCRPCIASFPELKELHTELNGKGISFLGVIYDDSTNSGIVKELLGKNNIDWRQLFISQDEKNSLVDRYKVTSYPTYFIVDKDRKIIYRDFGLSGFQRMKEFIQKKVL